MYKRIAFPLSLMMIALLIVCFDSLWVINLFIRQCVMENIHGHWVIDNYMQYVPLVVFLVLPGEHKWWHRILLALVCILLMQGISESLKSLTHILRPDGSTYNSFPSGHTGTAFVCATLLAFECKKRRGLKTAGYIVALATGMMRMINNRHWLSDVLFGAGLGILTVIVICWIYEKYVMKLSNDGK